MAGDLVFQRELLFLEPVEQVLVGVRPDFLRLDTRVERLVLACQCLDVGLFHQILLSSVDDAVIKSSKNAPVAYATRKTVEKSIRLGVNGELGYVAPCMNDDDPTQLVAALKAEHRRLDTQIDQLREGGTTDQIELARLKKRKLVLKDQIASLEDELFPDIIA